MSIEGKSEQDPKPQIEFQRMTRDDLEMYIALEKKVESRTYAAAQNLVEAEEEFSKGPMFFIKHGDKVVGAASYVVEENDGVYINGLAIDPEYQSHGFGEMALKQILDQVSSAPQVWLRTHPENPAVKLYQSHGFVVTDREENYDNTGEPRLILTRDQATS